MKTCPKCGVEVHGRKKYCSDKCKYWFNMIRKDNERDLAPARQRTDKFFYMVTGSTVAKMRGSQRQGRRSGGLIMGSMSARIMVTVETVSEVNTDNVIKHFEGILGYIPTYIRLCNGERVPKDDVFSRLGIKL